MFRSLVVLVALLGAAQCSSAVAQGRGHGRYKHRSHRGSSFGFSIGIGTYPGYGLGYLDPYRFDGFGYDPYRYGSFRAPDLLDDLYFQEQHRYQSHFPGRYPPSRRHVPPPLVYPLTPPVAGSPSRGHSVAPMHPVATDVAGQLQVASRQLADSLSRRHDRDVWMQYLAPHQISPWIATGNLAELRQLLRHYHGVSGNPGLRHIAMLPGFQTTRTMLGQFVLQAARQSESATGQPSFAPPDPTPARTPAPRPKAVERLPIPAQTATPDPPSITVPSP